MLSYKGRIGRGSWWIGTIVLALISTLLEGFLPESESGQVALNDMSRIGSFFALAIAALLFWMTVVINARRWHDRNKSGWWSLLYLAAYLPILIFIISEPHIPTEDYGSNLMVAIIFSFAILLWPVVELGFLRGTDGANKYGVRTLSLLD
jgi:uncharacterized membrane protein YhaH (DUF805 family)